MHSCACFEADTTLCSKVNTGNGRREVECERGSIQKKKKKKNKENWEQVFSVHTQNKYYAIPKSRKCRKKSQLKKFQLSSQELVLCPILLKVHLPFLPQDESQQKNVHQIFFNHDPQVRTCSRYKEPWRWKIMAWNIRAMN